MENAFNIPTELKGVCDKFGLPFAELGPTMETGAVLKLLHVSRTTLGVLGQNGTLERINVGTSKDYPRYKYLTLSVLRLLQKNITV